MKPLSGKPPVLMGSKVGRAETKKPVTLAKDFREGKVFAAGKALVPYVKQELYDQIRGVLVLRPRRPQIQALSRQLQRRLPTETARKSRPQSVVDPWSHIKVGSLVLCREGDAEQPPWWESVVVSIAKDGGR